MAIGSGWQALVAYVNLSTYYIIGLPIGCVLGFKTSLGVAVSINKLLCFVSINDESGCVLSETLDLIEPSDGSKRNVVKDEMLD